MLHSVVVRFWSTSCRGVTQERSLVSMREVIRLGLEGCSLELIRLASIQCLELGWTSRELTKLASTWRLLTSRLDFVLKGGPKGLRRYVIRLTGVVAEMDPITPIKIVHLQSL